MAKLNGVSVVSEKITYNGAEYVKTEADAKVGDIIRIGKECVSYVNDGAFYEINYVDSDGDASFVDEDGDSFYVNKLDETPDVFTKVSAQSAPVSVAAKLPSTLPSDYVIHEGAVYRKESRKAEVGELAVTIADRHHGWPDGVVVKCTEERLFRSETKTTLNGCGNQFTQFLDAREYAVLVPTDTVTIGGVEYTLEKRKAAKGDLIMAIKSPNADRYASGDIGRTMDDNGSVPDVEWLNGKHNAIRFDRFVVLVPKAAANPAPSYTEVKRKANVGERIRIVAAEFTMGRYRNGDEFTVTSVKESTGGVRFTAPKGEAFAYQSEYVVLEEAKPAPAARLKVGDYAKVTEYGAKDMSGYRKAGDIVKITEDDGSTVPFNTEGLDGKTGWASVKSLVRATDEEVAAAKRKNVKVGDYVRITGNKAPNDGGPHHYAIGDIVEVRYVYSDSVSCVRKSDNRSQTVSAINYEPVTAAEAEAARQKAEEASAKAAESAKWSAIGRKVGEIRKGDVVRVKNACGGRNPNGRIGIAFEDGDTGRCRVATVENPNGVACMASVELIAPVESLFN